MRSILYGLLAFSSISLITAQQAEDYKVTSLPGIDIDTLNFTQYAGHIEISSETNANMFFWMIESEVKTDTEKLIIWLNGGPGCSSMDGLFLENGPFRVNPDLSLTVNEGGWQNYATNIFVDQPVGTGFSFANTDSYMHNMSQITEEFVTFVDKLFITFPHLAEQDLYIAGESYAGTYIPYFASRLLELNKEHGDYNLKGIAIGNGWISAKHQYNAYYDFSVKYNLIEQDRLPLVSAHLKICQDNVKAKETIHVNSCEKILTDIMDSNTHENKVGEKKCINIYDIRSKEESYPECGLSWPYELDDVTKYLRLAEVKSAVHADKQILGWKECTSLVSASLKGDESQPAYYLLPGILEEIPVLLYSGEYDLICNYVGTEYLIGNMTWNGAKGFNKATKKEIWKIDNKLAGYYTQERNLVYVMIKDGSHMVPYDRPIECLDMINRFIQVGNNVVKGRLSQVGDALLPTTSKVPKPTSAPSSSPPTNTKIDGDTKFEDDYGQGEMVPEQDKWSQYYNWGTSTLIIVILFALTLCCCWCCGRNKRLSASAADEFGGAPQREREGLNSRKNRLFGTIRNLFTKKSSNANQRKFRLGDNDESNELDELVIETPMLFEAHSDDDDNVNQHHQHFAIDDEEDGEEEEDSFDDFADFDDGETLINSKNTNSKSSKRKIKK